MLVQVQVLSPAIFRTIPKSTQGRTSVVVLHALGSYCSGVAFRGRPMASLNRPNTSPTRERGENRRQSPRTRVLMFRYLAPACEKPQNFQGFRGPSRLKIVDFYAFVRTD